MAVVPVAHAWSLSDVGAAVAGKARAAAEQAKAAVQASDHHGAREAAEAFASIVGGSHDDASGGAETRGAVAGAGASASESINAGSSAKIRTLSWTPRAMVWSNFITQEEADHVLELGAARLVRSDVVDTQTGVIIRSKERTSSGAFLPGRNLDPVVRELEARIARWVQTAHFDMFFDDVHVKNGGQRIATVILYLSDVEEGGETVFPDSPTRPSEAEAASFSACGKKGLGVRPKKGDALLFFSLRPDGKTQDKAALHAGCPVVKGTKWIATKWIRVGRYHDWGDPDETPEDARATGRQAAARQGSDSAAGANVPGDADVNAARDEL
ncbi:hypothetical protein MNEG_6137 [Monoraphidium neglectum]|uniref:Fe2OG dioxygenase domain-containing protein n=1 Tax=Monoraphidium neglectum TaxID=145388 RepID=A0A0D2L3Q1_9CHLO|nr:hypothetical protein MNEG_6137 [Monoraphidium neglectum]KIZ01824.1 hypothetical protein MNEG_6137 [Monoraphidium neglectum]|eukprot:XP_013900843.1 hypothetical protein MNEG_6137 [Monoraphidium neglectum]